MENVIASKPCTEYEIFAECRGRCLYANITKRWSDEAYIIVCNTVRNLITSLKQELPRVEQLIIQRKIKLADFTVLDIMDVK